MRDDAGSARTKKKRVTLTLDPDIHEQAVRIARARGLSLSGLVQGLLGEQHEQTAEEWLESLTSHAVDVVPPAPGEDARYDQYETKYYPEQARAEGRDKTPHPADRREERAA